MGCSDGIVGEQEDAVSQLVHHERKVILFVLLDQATGGSGRHTPTTDRVALGSEHKVVMLMVALACPCSCYARPCR